MDQLNVRVLPTAAHLGLIYVAVRRCRCLDWDENPYDMKIGFTSRSPVVRASEVKGSLIMAWPGSTLGEKAMHDRHEARRIGDSEWYHPDHYLLSDLYAFLGSLDHLQRHKAWPLLNRVQRSLPEAA